MTATVNLSTTMQVYNWANSIQFCLLTPTCVVCAAAGQSARELCAGCEADLPWQLKGCQLCGLTLPDHAGANICRDCQQKPAPFGLAASAFIYGQPISQLITALKFNGQLSVARLLGGLFAQALPEDVERPHFILPVPLHAMRLRERGFNQSEELARAISRVTDIPLRARAAERRRQTAVQSGLSARKRRANVRGAFHADVDSVKGGHIAILDDVVTTGSTVKSLADTLLRAGAARVDLWCIARA